MNDLSQAVCRLPANRIQQFAQSAFEKVGCSSSDAAEAASVLLWASLRGIDTHGIRNLHPYYLSRIQAGEIEPRPQITVERETSNSACINGGGGLGLVAATSAMRLAMQKANAAGVGLVTVQNSHHLGPAGYYASMGLDDGMIGVCTTGHFFGEGNRIGIAPINSPRPMFSTNPISFAAPCAQRPAFVLDMSTSVTTVNRIEMFAQVGRSIPTGWAKDTAGETTVDPREACVLNSLGGDPLTGGHKGVGLAMMASILSGVLSGGWKRIASEHQAKYSQATMGHFVAALRIDSFMPVDEFQQSMDAMVDAVMSCPPVDCSSAVQYPGSAEHVTYETRLREGIPLDGRLLDELRQVQQSLSIPVSLDE